MSRTPLLCFVALGACSGDDGGTGGTGVQGHALILHGPSAPSSSPRIGTPPAPPADGYWAISPNQARITLTDLTFVDAELQPHTTTLTNCMPTYKRNDSALTQLLDCPFEVPPGTYLSVTIGASTTYEMLIDDPINGFFTDPNAPTKLAISGTGPGQFASFTVPGPGGVGDVVTAGAFFASPFEVAA